MRSGLAKGGFWRAASFVLSDVFLSHLLLPGFHLASPHPFRRKPHVHLQNCFRKTWGRGVEGLGASRVMRLGHRSESQGRKCSSVTFWERFPFLDPHETFPWLLCDRGKGEKSVMLRRTNRFPLNGRVPTQVRSKKKGIVESLFCFHTHLGFPVRAPETYYFLLHPHVYCDREKFFVATSFALPPRAEHSRMKV